MFFYTFDATINALLHMGGIAGNASIAIQTKQTIEQNRKTL